MNQVTTRNGLIATLTAIFVSGQSIRKRGWTFTAMLTPAVSVDLESWIFRFLFLKDGNGQLATSILGYCSSYYCSIYGVCKI